MAMTEKEARKAISEALRNRRLIESGWIGGILVGAPDGIPEDQLYVMRFSFYRGAQFLLQLFSQPPDGPDDMVVEAMSQMVEDIQDEVSAFMQEHRNAPKEAKIH